MREKLMRKGEVAQMLGVTRETVEKLESRGQIAPVGFLPWGPGRMALYAERDAVKLQAARAARKAKAAQKTGAAA